MRAPTWSVLSLCLLACTSSRTSGDAPTSGVDGGVDLDADATAPADAGDAADEADASDATDATDDGDAGYPLPPTTGVCVLAADSGVGPVFSPSYVPAKSASIEQDKAFYLVTLLESRPSILAAIAADPTLSAAGAARDQKLRAAVSTCGADAGCLADAVALTDTDAQALGTALVAALGASGDLATLARDHLRPSGVFALHAALADDALLAAAWADTAKALSSAVDGYVRPLDGAKALGAAQTVIAQHAATMPFFQPITELILASLHADGRDEAERYEPLAEGENAKALARAKTIDWNQYPYTVIVVPGQGPNSPSVEFDPIGQKRCDIAYTRWAAKLAPFLMTSGGHVHPDRTPYCESLEMKKYLMSHYGVPEEAIFVDPHARHTTTNVRNTSRLVLRYGIPGDRKLLITSDFGQTLYIGDHADIFDPRCLRELFYLPYATIEKLGTYDTCIVPTTNSLYASGLDPLDP